MKQKKSPYPDWVIKHRRPGIEIRKMRDNYYVYEFSSFYDKEKKKGRKKTGKYLGKITQEDGFIPSGSIKVPKSLKIVNESKLSTKEYGLSAFIQHHCKDLVDLLKIHFPEQWEWLLTCLYARLVHTAPIKNIGYYFKKSYLSEELNITVNSKTVSALLRDIGSNRDPINAYMKAFMGHSVALIDATSIISYSHNLNRAHIGLSKKGTYDPLFNLLYFYQPDNYRPAYYRLFDGNIKDVKMISMAIEESGYKDALVIADKGFFSEENLGILEDAGLNFIIPLKRNSKLVESDRYANLTKGRNKFLFAGRVIYYESYTLPKSKAIRSAKKKATEEKQVYLYVDEEMMVKEKKDFVHRMANNPQSYTEEVFQNKINDFGSFAVITNQKGDAETIFQYYKSRVGVEVLFDGVKNILGNDYTYMQNNDALEGWMFINHLALQVHHKIYELLKTQKMLPKYSIRDFIEYLSDIRKVRVNDQWVLEPIIKEQQALLTRLGISIT